MRLTLLIAVLVVPFSIALAASSDSEAPPTSVQNCPVGKIWDQVSQSCQAAQDSRFDDDQRFEAARALAFAGRYDDALAVLATAQAPDHPRMLSYIGFALRKSGHAQGAMAHYQRALAIDPDYNLARAYLGQALIDQGDVEGAKQQLAEIRDRGGRDTWAYASLKQALRAKSGY